MKQFSKLLISPSNSRQCTILQHGEVKAGKLLNICYIYTNAQTGAHTK
jgi:hypothetical protein